MKQRLIDSEVAYRFLTDQILKVTGKYSEGVNKGLNIARSAMRNSDAIPTIDPESLRPHGEWVGLTIDNYSDCAIFECSQCKTATGILRPTWKFCPHCGARMED